MKTVCQVLACIISLLFAFPGSTEETRMPMRFPEGASVAINPMEVDPAEYIKRIILPPGFEISLYAHPVEGPRQMSLAANGTLYVGTRFNRKRETIGKVYAVVDTDGDYVADEIRTVVEGLNVPNGVAWHDDDLYIAEINRVIRIRDIAGIGGKHPDYSVIAEFPEDVMHGWKFIGVGADDSLYVPVGAPCNICEPSPEYSAIFRMKLDGSARETYARGIRNTVGFDWHPQTGEMWFTDNGRDLWGDDRPPEEINRVSQPGQHFGYPYRFGKDLVDDTYEANMDAADFVPAAYEMPAHTAGLGVEFYTGNSFPEKYHNQMFVAYHGSWNRSVPAGYNIALITLRDNQVIGHEIFARGWLLDEKFWGRPVDIEIMADGSMLVSDDYADSIYRIRYVGNQH